MTSFAGCARRSAMIAREVLVQRLRRASRPRSMSKPTLMSSTALRWNCGRSSRGRPSRRAITTTGNGNVSSRDEVGAAAVDERVDVLVDDVDDELAFPGVHRLAAERLLHEAAVRVVLGLVHLEDRVAHHRAHHVGVPARRERVAVAEHRLHGVETERGVHVGEVVEVHELPSSSASGSSPRSSLQLDRVLGARPWRRAGTGSRRRRCPRCG